MHRAEDRLSQGDWRWGMARWLAALAAAPAVRLGSAMAAAGLLAWPTAAAAQQIVIKEYALPLENPPQTKNPWGITAGPDGAIYFTEENFGSTGFAARIGRIATDGSGSVWNLVG